MWALRLLSDLTDKQVDNYEKENIVFYSDCLDGFELR